MILDCHIHAWTQEGTKEDFDQKLKQAGVDGGVVLSLPPKSFPYFGELEKDYTTQDRIKDLFYWTAGNENLFPFYWIDPLESDAIQQVDYAVQEGVMGFKVICNAFYPGDERAMKVYRAIANYGKPILFHSGILFDGTNSSHFQRPANFEALLDIDGLKFAMAHGSWPWIDEMIAVFGKFRSAYRQRPDLSVELFVDITPGTPAIYREELLTKLYKVGYDTQKNVLFGTDCSTNRYNIDYATQIMERDNGIYQKLELEDHVIENVYANNLKRFLNLK